MKRTVSIENYEIDEYFEGLINAMKESEAVIKTFRPTKKSYRTSTPTLLLLHTYYNSIEGIIEIYLKQSVPVDDVQIKIDKNKAYHAYTLKKARTSLYNGKPILPYEFNSCILPLKKLRNEVRHRFIEHTDANLTKENIANINNIIGYVKYLYELNQLKQPEQIINEAIHN